MKIFCNLFFKTSLLAAIAAAMLSGTVRAQTEHLPLETYLALLSPTFGQFWEDPQNGNFIIFDAAGRLNTLFQLGLETSVSGSVAIRHFRDDTQQATVIIHTNNALCWGFNADGEPAFGYRPSQLALGIGTAALGKGTTRLVYTRRPETVSPFFGAVESLTSTIRCEGLLRAGSGFDEGTPGFAQTTQVGLYNTGVPSGCPQEHDANCFPAEKVQFKPTGK